MNTATLPSNPTQPADYLEDDLEALLAVPAVSTTALDFIDELLLDGAAVRAEKEAVRAARASLARGNLLQTEREELQRIVAGWEMSKEWEPVADEVHFSVQLCSSCSTRQSHYIGQFQKQQHRHHAIERWVRADTSTKANLPKGRKEFVTATSLCENCCADYGW